MKIVVGFTELHPATEKALQLWASNYEVNYHDVSSSNEEYFNVLAKYWSLGESFIVIEHDVEIRKETIPKLTRCSRSWCAFSYAMGASGYQTALGCTKFSTALLQKYPNAMKQAGDKHDPWSAPRDWRRLDRRIFEVLVELGETEHRHDPPLKHHNLEKKVPVELELFS